MLKNFCKAIKQKIALWVLSDPNIILRYNNQLRIEDKYEIIDLNIMANVDMVDKYFEPWIKNKTNSMENPTNSPFIDYYLKSISQEFSNEIINKRLIQIQPVKDIRIPNKNQGYMITIKVLKQKSC